MTNKFLEKLNQELDTRLEAYLQGYTEYKLKNMQFMIDSYSEKLVIYGFLKKLANVHMKEIEPLLKEEK